MDVSCLSDSSAAFESGRGFPWPAWKDMYTGIDDGQDKNTTGGDFQWKVDASFFIPVAMQCDYIDYATLYLHLIDLIQLQNYTTSILCSRLEQYFHESAVSHGSEASGQIWSLAICTWASCRSLCYQGSKMITGMQGRCHVMDCWHWCA